MNSKCPICSQRAPQAFTATVLQKYEAVYHSCPNCGLLFVHEPHWLDEAYQQPIAVMDTGLLTRNLYNAARTSAILSVFFGLQNKYVDVAGGYGVFVRLMRDIGFDFYWQDKYSPNLFARHFEHSTAGAYELATAFEVLEHLTEPQTFLAETIGKNRAQNLLFSTTTFSGEPPAPDWHYYAPNSGQHVAFYQKKTLAFLADRMGLHYCGTTNFHLFSRKKINNTLFAICASKASLLAFPFIRIFTRSKTEQDFNKVQQELSRME